MLGHLVVQYFVSFISTAARHEPGPRLDVGTLSYEDALFRQSDKWLRKLDIATFSVNAVGYLVLSLWYLANGIKLSNVWAVYGVVILLHATWLSLAQRSPEFTSRSTAIILFRVLYHTATLRILMQWTPHVGSWWQVAQALVIVSGAFAQAWLSVMLPLLAWVCVPVHVCTIISNAIFLQYHANSNLFASDEGKAASQQLCNLAHTSTGALLNGLQPSAAHVGPDLCSDPRTAGRLLVTSMQVLVGFLMPSIWHSTFRLHLVDAVGDDSNDRRGQSCKLRVNTKMLVRVFCVCMFVAGVWWQISYAMLQVFRS